jgi:hypothetical protein
LKTCIRILCASALVLGGCGLASSGAARAAAMPQSQHATAQASQAQRQLLRRQANGIFDREMQRAKDGDCDTAATNAAIDQCLTQRMAITDLNLNTYESALRGLLALRPNAPSGASPVAEFDQMEHQWRAYLASASAAAAQQMDAGSGGPSAGMMTHLQLVRGHMKELDNIYFSLLHL